MSFFPLGGELIDLSDRNNLGGSGGGGQPQPVGFIGYPPAPALPTFPMPPANSPFNYPTPPGGGFNHGGAGGSGGGGFLNENTISASAPPAFNYNIPPNSTQQQSPMSMEKNDLNINAKFLRVWIVIRTII